MNNQPAPVNPQLLVVWVLWAAFQTGIFVLYTFLHVPETSPLLQATPTLPWMVALVPLLVSTVIRWTLLPRATSPQMLLVFMFAGIGLAEMVTFLGIFLFARNQTELFVLSALGIFQYIPLYARRILTQGSAAPEI